MILLYRDPHGRKQSVGQHTLTDTKAGNGMIGIQNCKTAELESKLATLQKNVQKREKTIAELRQRIEALTNDTSIVQVSIQILSVITDTISMILVFTYSDYSRCVS